MKVVIAGGTGLIGRQLTKELAKYDHTVVILSRNPDKVISVPKNVELSGWDGKNPTRELVELINESQAVINLAGENIGGEGFLPSRLTEVRKQRIRDSRIKSTEVLVDMIKEAENKPQVFAHGSAIGYYGFHDDEQLTEASPPGDDFFAEWKDWEPVSEPVESMGVRRVINHHYPHPDRWFERHLFRELERRGFDYRTLNQAGGCTLHYDVKDLAANGRLADWIPNWCFWFINWALERNGGRCSMKLDWFAGKGVQPSNETPPQVITDVHPPHGPLSDHDPIVLDFRFSN